MMLQIFPLQSQSPWSSGKQSQLRQNFQQSLQGLKLTSQEPAWEVGPSVSDLSAPAIRVIHCCQQHPQLLGLFPAVRVIPRYEGYPQLLVPSSCQNHPLLLGHPLLLESPLPISHLHLLGSPPAARVSPRYQAHPQVLQSSQAGRVTPTCQGNPSAIRAIPSCQCHPHLLGSSPPVRIIPTCQGHPRCQSHPS